MARTAKSKPNLADFLPLAGLIVGVALVATMGYFLFSNVGSLRDFLRKTDTYPLAISTSPTDAIVVLDGQPVGKSPVTTLTYPGAHTLTIRKDGYAPLTKAIELSRDSYRRDKDGVYLLEDKGSPWSFNYDLVSAAPSGTPVPGVVAKGGDNLKKLETQILELRSSIIANPDQALSYGLLKGRVDSIERDVTRLREQAEFSSNLMMGIWATLVAIFLTLIALVFSLFRRQVS